MHIKNTRCSFQIRSRGTTFIAFTKCYFFFFKKRAEDPVCVIMLQTETVEKYIAWFGSQSSGFVFPLELQGSFSLKQVESCRNSQVVCISSLEACRKHGPPSVTTTVPLALYMYSGLTARGTDVQEKYRF